MTEHTAMDSGEGSVREREFMTRISRLDNDPDNEERIRRLLAAPLDWNWIVVTAGRHKVVQLLWDNLRRKNLISAALGTGGLPELWSVYIAQLYATGRERNTLWLANAAEVTARLRDAGIRLVIIKGGALIGDIYTTRNRFLNDIDFIARRADAERIKKAMFDLGYQYGSYDYASERIEPIDRRIERAWLFNNHVMPNFYRPCAQGTVPYFKIQIGFDFFDPFEEYAIDEAAVVDAAVPKADGSGLLVPAPIDTLINLCCHIYREGVSLVYNDYNVNWQLGKFCDLLSFLLKHEDALDVDHFVTRVDAEGIRKPAFYGLYHTQQVYGHPILRPWLEATDPTDRDFLDELTDGSRRERVTEPFDDRLFSLRPVRAEFRAGWNRQFTRADW
jgi:hypothetical protein